MGPLRTFGKVVQWIAIGYAVVVIAVAIIVAIALTQPTVGANFAGVWLIIVAAPLSVLAAQLPVYGTPALLVLTAAGLIQAAVLWFIGRFIRRRG